MLTLLMRSDRDRSELYLYNGQELLNSYVYEAERQLAENINSAIKELLDKSDKNMSMLKGIGVFSGPGSFTSLRIIHSVANALAYGLKLPIVAANGSNWQAKALKMLGEGQNQKLVLPEYGAPVHITKPRK